MGHDWNGSTQIQLHLAAVTRISKKRAQSAGQEFRSFRMQTPRLTLHKPHHVVRTQLGPHDRAVPETLLEKTADERNVIDGRSL